MATFGFHFGYPGVWDCIGLSDCCEMWNCQNEGGSGSVESIRNVVCFGCRSRCMCKSASDDRNGYELLFVVRI
jgi:hypothetical protein